MRINLKLVLLIIVVLIAAAVTSKSQTLIEDPGLPDTIYVDSQTVSATLGQASIPVTFVNDTELGAVQLVLVVNSPDMIIDSFSFVGGRLDYISTREVTIADSTVIAWCAPMSEPLIPVGSGLLGNLHLSWLPSISPQLVTIDSIRLTLGEVEWATTFSDGMSEFEPQFEAGALNIDGLGCCVGRSGNINGDPEDGINIADLTWLVAYLFSGGQEPVCWEEGNVNGDAENKINIGDLTFLVAFLFSGGEEPRWCL